MSALQPAFAAATTVKDEAFDFDKEVARAWRDFPEARGRIIFIDAGNDARLIYPDGFEGREEAARTVEKYNAKRIMERGFAAFNMKNSFCKWIGERKFLFLLTEKHPHDMLDHTAPVAMETTFVFDHELGHAVIKGGTYRDATHNHGEATADAYATIRHFQRYGADSPYIDALVANRAFDLVFRQAGYGDDHFTSPVIEKILEQRYSVDWNSLTPQETAEMARTFVYENELSVAARTALDKSFRPLHEQAERVEQGDIRPVARLSARLATAGSPVARKYGLYALQAANAHLARAGENRMG